jgi:hypothetical protein
MKYPVRISFINRQVKDNETDAKPETASQPTMPQLLLQRMELFK